MTILTLKIKRFLEKKSGEIWINNQEMGVCLDCSLVKPIFYTYKLPSGKVLSQTCQDCFQKYNYFNESNE